MRRKPVLYCGHRLRQLYHRGVESRESFRADYEPSRFPPELPSCHLFVLLNRLQQDIFPHIIIMSTGATTTLEGGPIVGKTLRRERSLSEVALSSGAGEVTLAVSQCAGLVPGYWVDI
jgi:hypothetical protein